MKYRLNVFRWIVWIADDGGDAEWLHAAQLSCGHQYRASDFDSVGDPAPCVECEERPQGATVARRRATWVPDRVILGP